MNLYHCKITVTALMDHYIAAPEITKEMRQQYKIISEVGDVQGVDGKTYAIEPTLKKKVKQESMFD